jgi:hypothetical protein
VAQASSVLTEPSEKHSRDFISEWRKAPAFFQSNRMQQALIIQSMKMVVNLFPVWYIVYSLMKLDRMRFGQD